MRLYYREGRMAQRLRDEHDEAIAAVCRLPQRDRGAFWDLVGHPGERLDVGGIGLGQISPDRTRHLYEPCDESGPTALIFAARDLPLRGGGQVLDLVAWLPRSGEIFCRFGAVDVFGEWHLAVPLVLDEPLVVFADPGSWARANGAGICILDWARARSSLRHVPAFLAPDVDFGRRLREMLVPQIPRRPRILVPRRLCAA